MDRGITLKSLVATLGGFEAFLLDLSPPAAAPALMTRNASLLLMVVRPSLRGSGRRPP